MNLAAILLSAFAFQQGEVPDFQSLHLVFAEEHSTSVLSGFGHLFVCLPEHPILTTSDLLVADAVNFGADTGPLGHGAWIGEYKLEICHELVRKNTVFEQRDLVFFELNIPTEDLSRLRGDLAARLGRQYPYDFLRRNCGQYILDWLDGPSETPLAWLYLTPREAVGRILARYPPKHIRRIRSDLALLEGYIQENCPEMMSLVQSGLDSPELLAEIPDLTLRLLAIRVARSQADQRSFRLLEELSQRTLEQDTEGESARRLLEFIDKRNLQIAEWPAENEGPKVGFGTSFYQRSKTWASYVQWKAGLRDDYSAPRTSGLLKEVHFLEVKAQLDGAAGDIDVLLAAISTQRDFRRLLGGLSDGVGVGYRGLPNVDGISGLFASAWIGLSTESPVGWFGTRVALVGDELSRERNVYFAPGLTWNYLSESSACHLRAQTGQDLDLGWEAEFDWLPSGNINFLLNWTLDPSATEVYSVGFVYYF